MLVIEDPQEAINLLEHAKDKIPYVEPIVINQTAGIGIP